MRTIKTTTISILALGLLSGSAVGVAAQDEEAADPMALSAFSGQGDGQEPPEFSVDPDTGLARIVVPTYQVGDPRASGRKVAIEELASVEGDGIVWDVTGASVRIDNDGGAWVGTVRNVTHVQEPAGVTVGSFEEYVGEGGYAGLTLFIFNTVGPDGDLVSNAFIVPTDLVPPMPSPPDAE